MKVVSIRKEALSMAAVVEKRSLLDEKMSEVYDWSDSDLPVRDALWDHFMEASNHNTDKTEAEVKPYNDMSNDELKGKVEAVLKA